MSFKKVWICENIDVSEEQIKLCSSDIILAKLLKKRGIDTKEKIESFLNPLKSKLLSPDAFLDMEKSLDRIKTAIDKNETITVYGDFDADGITATAVLYLTLKKIGANVEYYLPNRDSESHGLNTKALVNIISKKKSKLIITVDCGISNIQEVKFAKGFGADIIITDHHEAPDVLPEAYAILNPKAGNSLNTELSLDELKSLNYLAGVGVAFKLSCKLLEAFNCKNFVNDILPIVAVGTIGDVVELIGENRTLVSMGLELLKKGWSSGLQKLLISANISDISKLTSENIAFGVVPRLNAAGRLESPDTALNVLILDSDDEIDKNIKMLNDLNSLRQQLCDEVFEQAKLMYEQNKFSNKKSIILYNPDWHIGIIGIVASKLVETFNKPTLLMTKDTNNENIIRCSSRSIEQINIHSVLSEHKEFFEGFGGHKMAAGFSFDETKISVDQMKNLINKTIDEQSLGVDFSQTRIYADLVVEPEDITIQTIKNINQMEPFGSGNNSPLFIMNSLLLKNYKMMGQNNNHLKIFAEKNSFNIECVKWNTPNFNLPENSPFNILFHPQINEFNGNTSIQYFLEDIFSEKFINDSKQDDYKILDHRNKVNIIDSVLDFVTSTKKKTCIYVSNSELKNKLKVNENIAKIIFNASNIPSEMEQLMFFEAPLSVRDFKNIIESSGANLLHLMNFVDADLSVDYVIKKLSGMLKYVLTNKQGKFGLSKLSAALDIDDDTLMLLLNLLDDVEMIDLTAISDEDYKITYVHPIELSKIKQSEVYSQTDEKIKEINEFKNFYKTAEIGQLREIIK